MVTRFLIPAARPTWVRSALKPKTALWHRLTHIEASYQEIGGQTFAHISNHTHCQANQHTTNNEMTCTKPTERLCGNCERISAGV